GYGGTVLCFGPGSSLQSYDTSVGSPLALSCILAGVPTVDLTVVPCKLGLTQFVLRGPMVAVGEEPDPPPYQWLSRAPLTEWLDMAARLGAAVYNDPRSRKGGCHACLPRA